MRDRVETAIGAGPIATMFEHASVDAAHGVRSREELWRRTSLRWADASSRSLLLFSLAIAGLLVGYGLSLFLHRPPEVTALTTFRVLSISLFVLAVVVAPAPVVYRLIAGFCIALHALCAATIVLLSSTEAFGVVRYGTVDAVDFAGFGVLLVAWLLVRARHPLTILAGVLSYCVAGSTFFVRVAPRLRELVAETPHDEMMTAKDENLIRVSVFVLGCAIVLLCWWLDSWLRGILPMHGLAEPPDSGREPRRDVPGRIWYAWIAIAVGLDPVAIVLAHIARRPTRRGRLSADEDWWASVVLCIASARIVLVWLALTALAISLLDTTWRA